MGGALVGMGEGMLIQKQMKKGGENKTKMCGKAIRNPIIIYLSKLHILHINVCVDFWYTSLMKKAAKLKWRQLRDDVIKMKLLLIVCK